jgi:hypothetical protein
MTATMASANDRPPALVIIQRKLLDGHSLSPLAIWRFDRAEIFAATADDDDAPASQVGGLFRIGTPGHASKIMAAEREGESARDVAFMGLTATSRASTPAFAMSCSMARSSTPSEKLRSSSKAGGSSSKAGGAITIRSGRMPRSATSHQHQRCSCPHSPRGRLRYAERLRRPRWRNGQP